MKMKYRFVQLSEDEQELLEMVLMEELELQSWFAICFSETFGEEIIVTTQ